jgi:hypothetical protein
MPLLEHHLYLAVPLVLAALMVLGAVITLRSDDRARKRLLVVGAAWYVISLIPTYNNAISLNDSNGERLLYLPSVGMALAVAAVTAPLLQARLGRLVLGLGALVAVAACLGASAEYVTAATIRNRVVADTARLAQKDATVVALNIPDSYRSARLLGAGYADAVMRAGRPDLHVLTCVPSIVQNGTPQDLRFTTQSDGEILASTTSSLPFDTPQSGRAISASGCSYRPGLTGRLAPGLDTEVLLRLARSGTGTVYLWFDGATVRRCTVAACPALTGASPAPRPR